MVDSADRSTTVYPLCNDFQITKRSSLLNGFFTRIGATEVVMEWTTPNVPTPQDGDYTYSINGVPVLAVGPLLGFYTVEEALDEIQQDLNAAGGVTGVTVAIGTLAGGGAALTFTGPVATVISLTGSIIQRLNGGQNIAVTIPAGGGVNVEFTPGRADLRPARYLDIVCNQLTNNQSVKDASTAPIVRDVLVRWYFDFDNQNPLDEYGFPILMGYAPFYLRRLYNPPKQIQWQTNIPVGNLSLQLYNNNGILQAVSPETNYLMTLQISEN
jgi:hypothetical protein